MLLLVILEYPINLKLARKYPKKSIPKNLSKFDVNNFLIEALFALQEGRGIKNSLVPSCIVYSIIENEFLNF